jgi:hypothetical protein
MRICPSIPLWAGDDSGRAGQLCNTWLSLMSQAGDKPFTPAAPSAGQQHIFGPAPISASTQRKVHSAHSRKSAKAKAPTCVFSKGGSISTSRCSVLVYQSLATLSQMCGVCAVLPVLVGGRASGGWGTIRIELELGRIRRNSNFCRLPKLIKFFKAPALCIIIMSRFGYT